MNELTLGGVNYFHAGILCSLWSDLRFLNPSNDSNSRSSHNPQGDEVDLKERRANEQARRLLQRVYALLAAVFIFEHPADSLMRKTAAVIQLMRKPGSNSVTFDQCMYGLRPIVIAPNSKQARKYKTNKFNDTDMYDNTNMYDNTAMTDITDTPYWNLPRLGSLHRLCDGTHKHQFLVGNIRLDWGWVKRSVDGAAYPHPLCRRLCALVLGACRGL